MQIQVKMRVKDLCRQLFHPLEVVTIEGNTSPAPGYPVLEAVLPSLRRDRLQLVLNCHNGYIQIWESDASDCLLGSGE